MRFDTIHILIKQSYSCKNVTLVTGNTDKPLPDIGTETQSTGTVGTNKD